MRRTGFWLGVFPILIALSGHAGPAGVSLTDPGAPWPRFELEALPPPPSAAEGAPVRLLARDLDGDGVRDLLGVWSSGGKSVVAWYPATGGRWVERGKHAFGKVRTILELDRAVEFAAVCDLDRDGQADVLLADSREPELLWVPAAGDGDRVLHRIPMPGTVTALAAVDWGRRDVLREPVAGVMTESGPALALVVPKRSDPARGPAVVLSMPGTVRGISAGRLDNDGWRDLAVATESGLVVVHGVDTGVPGPFEPPRAEPVRAVGGEVFALSATRFLRKDFHDLVFLDRNGLRLLDPTERSVREPRGGLPRTAAEGEAFTLAWEGVGRGEAVVVPRPGGLRLLGDVAMDSEGGWTARESAVLDLGVEPRAVVPMSRSADGLDDLVLALPDDPTPWLLYSRSRWTWWVTTNDDHDDGSCDSTDCSLREAILAANGSPGSDLITCHGLLTVVVTTSLPQVTGTTTFSFDNGSSWHVNADEAAVGTVGLWIEGDSCLVRTLSTAGHRRDGDGHGGVGLVLSGTRNTRVTDLYPGGNSRGLALYDTIDCWVGMDYGASGGADWNTEMGIEVYRSLSGSCSGNTVDMQAYHNGGDGIVISNAVDTTIGPEGTTICQDNEGSGIVVTGLRASGTVIVTGTLVGNGTPGAGDAGLEVDGCGSVTVGVDSPSGGVEISANHGDGILVRPTTEPVSITRCQIGFFPGGLDVSGNDRNGIFIDGASHVTISHCRIGLDHLNGIEAYGRAGAPVSDLSILSCTIGEPGGFASDNWGVYLNGVTNSTIHGNEVMANEGGGIAIVGSDSTGNTVTDNYVGLSRDDPSLGSGNEGIGILIDDGMYNRIGPGNQVGHTQYTAEGGGSGIVVRGVRATENNLSGNSIFSNDGLGIDLGGDGPTFPDDGDPDEGPNHLMNQPLLSFAGSCGGTTWIYGRLEAPPTPVYPVPMALALSFYSNDACDPSGWGEGQTPLGYEHYVTAPSGGNVSFVHEIPVDLEGQALTSLTTSFFGSSSELSNCVVVRSGRPGDVTADCLVMADDLAMLDHAVTDPYFAPPGDPDLNQDGETDTLDLVLTVKEIFW